MTLKEKARAKVKELDERMAELNALFESETSPEKKSEIGKEIYSVMQQTNKYLRMAGADEPSDKIFDQKAGKEPNLAYCTPIRIYQKDNKEGCSLKAIIAHTFPIQSLSTAYDRMVEYGKFCWKIFSESQI